MKKPTADVLKQARESLAEAMEQRSAAREAATTAANRLTASDFSEEVDGAALKTAQRNFKNLETLVQAKTDAITSLIGELELEQRMGGESGGAAPGVSVLPSGRLGDSEAKARNEFRLLAALDGIVNRNQKLVGLEAEMHKEGEKEMRSIGLETKGELTLPSWLVNGGGSLMQQRDYDRYADHRGIERRDYLAETTTAGGHLIETTVGKLIPVLQPKLQVEAMGATLLTGLTGNLDLPRNNAYGSATWEGETDDAAETQGTFDKVSLSPERLAAFSQVSRQAILQAKNVDLENFTRRDLNNAVKRALDLAAINGSGSGDQPTGILNTSSINSVTIGTDGGPLDWDLIVEFAALISEDNADFGKLGFLTTPRVAAHLKKIKRDIAGNGFIWEGPIGNGMIDGYMARVSTQMPSTLSKGSSGSILHAMIFANWQELIIAQWGGIDLTVDPYTLAKKGMVEMTVNSYWDIALMHLASFCECNEIDVS